MKFTKEFFANKKKIRIIISVLLIVAIIVVFISIILNLTIRKNIYERVKSETEFLARQQAEMINTQINEQFNIATTFACNIENGLSFHEKSQNKLISSIIDSHQLCMLAYADTNGNAISYQGNTLDNCADREYFSEIITGKKKYVCQYLPSIKSGDESRVIFSTAVWKNNKIQGVVFFSKEITVLKDSFFKQSMFEGDENAMIVDSNGNILVKNNRTEEKYASATKISDIYDVSEDNLEKIKSGSMVLKKNTEEVLAYSTIGTNDWYLLCSIDMSTARQKYATSLMAIYHLIFFASIIFTLGTIYFVALLWIQVKNSNKKYNQYKSQYNRTLNLLQKMKCMILEYDIQTRKITPNSLFEKMFGYGINDDFFDHIQNYRTKHPEFDFNGMIRELHFAIDNKETTAFESIFCEDKTVYKMISIVMMPILNETGRVVSVLCSIRENSAEHLALKEKVDMFNQIPGGTYRCNLDGPLYLEYIGERFCKMLGYTVNEFKTELEKDYIKIIADDDKDKYKQFIKESEKGPGVRTCEYKIHCKNGSILSVLDTMESIENASGIKQGYSVVIDISKYVERQKIVQQEMEQLERNLEMMRIKNSASQMQPHFLYNALSSIREIVMKDPVYASDLIYDFTVYLRACIRTMKDGELISIQQELDNIRAYANIEKMRMGKRLNMIYNIKDEEFKVVPLSIQPLVENAIRHGIYQKGKLGGTVSITVKNVSDMHMIIVKDDGVGFDYQKVRDEVERGKRESIGLDNVIYRVKNQLHATVIIDSKIGTGTTVTVCIPREKERSLNK